MTRLVGCARSTTRSRASGGESVGATHSARIRRSRIRFAGGRGSFGVQLSVSSTLGTLSCNRGSCSSHRWWTGDGRKLSDASPISVLLMTASSQDRKSWRATFRTPFPARSCGFRLRNFDRMPSQSRISFELCRIAERRWHVTPSLSTPGAQKASFFALLNCG